MGRVRWGEEGKVEMFMIVGRLTSRAAVIVLLGLLALSPPVFGQRQDPPATEPDDEPPADAPPADDANTN